MDKFKLLFPIFYFVFFINSHSQSIDVKPKGLESITNSRGELKKFRDASFGISTKELKSIEKAKFVENIKDGNEETLIYNGIVGGLDCDIFYFFINDKFLMGAYFFIEEHSNRNLYIDDYKIVLNNIKDKYGNPDYNDYEWLNDLYRDDVSEWGFAVSLGHLIYNSSWTFSNGSIYTVLKGDNYKITHMVRYRINDYDIEKEKIKKSSSDF